MEPEHFAVVSRVREQQYQAHCTQISSLRPDAAFHGLDISEMRLGFDEHIAFGRGDNGVAASSITRDWDRHLGANTHSRSKALPESGQQREMRPISNGIAVLIQRCGEFQAKHLSDTGEVVDAHGANLGALETACRVGAGASSPRDLSNTEPRGEASREEFLGQPLPQQAASPFCPCRRRWARRHRPHREGTGSLRGYRMPGKPPGFERRIARLTNMHVARARAGVRPGHVDRSFD